MCGQKLLRITFRYSQVIFFVIFPVVYVQVICGEHIPCSQNQELSYIAERVKLNCLLLHHR